MIHGNSMKLIIFYSKKFKLIDCFISWELSHERDLVWKLFNEREKMYCLTNIKHKFIIIKNYETLKTKMG